MKLVLKEGGASREFYHSELVTHIISDSPLSSEEEAIPLKDVVVHVSFLLVPLTKLLQSDPPLPNC